VNETHHGGQRPGSLSAGGSIEGLVTNFDRHLEGQQGCVEATRKNYQREARAFLAHVFPTQSVNCAPAAIRRSRFALVRNHCLLIDVWSACTGRRRSGAACPRNKHSTDYRFNARPRPMGANGRNGRASASCPSNAFQKSVLNQLLTAFKKKLPAGIILLSTMPFQKLGLMGQRESAMHNAIEAGAVRAK
jgi:hypothetical protein